MASAGVRQSQLSSVIGNPSRRQAEVSRELPIGRESFGTLKRH